MKAAQLSGLTPGVKFVLMQGVWFIFAPACCMYAGVQAALSERDGRAALTRCRLLFVQLARFASGSMVQILHHGHLHRQSPAPAMCEDGFAVVVFC